ncbi:unnamed protein product [Allacma fusca]|uniref:sphinganine-1-phosphate aldolase n=1 Tax=Allacma fusca TaxID=39272 RepID=A0A8J2L6M1_9HEXA|nr:unnamed protein product [Allacma fusca]
MCADKCADSLRAVVDPLVHLRNYLNQVLPSEPLVLVVTTAAASYIISRAVKKIPKDGVTQGFKRNLFKLARLVPSIRKEIETKIAATEKDIEEDLLKLYTLEGKDNPEFIVQLPGQGLTNDVIISKLEDYLRLGSYRWENNHVSGTVYHGGKELTELNTKVFSLATWTNPLHPDVFPGVCKMEAEVVQMASELFHGNDRTCGTVTSGGTESIILAVKAYRDYAVNVRGISNPEILVPKTAHAAFDKAAELLNIGIKHVPICSTTMKVQLNVMKSMITKNTCMLVGSTPAFPHGCMDDIQGIAKLGLRYNIPVHVDACLGGFLLVFMPKAGFEIPPFDFSVDGVTSISADTHKYAFAPKGSSVLLFSDKKFKHQQYFVQTNWPGGIYATATLAGSRPGVVIAGCWSSLLHFGLDGYTDITRKIINTSRLIEAGLRNISGIFVFGEPQVSVIALGSKDFDIFRLADILNKKGWSLNNLQFPSSIHICVTYRHTEEGVVDQFLKDVAEAVDVIKLSPQEHVSGAVALYASSQQIPDRSLVGDIIAIYIDTLYKTTKRDNADGTSKPKRKFGMHLNGSVDLNNK